MRMRNIIILILTLAAILSGNSCIEKEKQPKDLKPEISQMKAISELAVMECYYHNVAKVNDKDAKKFMFWTKDRRFWIEYSGIVKIGIDASKLEIAVKDETVTITIPEAEVLDTKIDPHSLTPDSYIVDKNSVDIKGEDETNAFKVAQENMKKTAANDSALLTNAQQRAQKLLEEYVNNIGKAVGKNYKIEWKYIDTD